MIRATAGKQQGTDIEQYIQAIPNLVVNVPNVGDVDVSKVNNVSPETINRICSNENATFIFKLAF